MSQQDFMQLLVFILFGFIIAFALVMIFLKIKYSPDNYSIIMKYFAMGFLKFLEFYGIFCIFAIIIFSIFSK